LDRDKRLPVRARRAAYNRWFDPQKRDINVYLHKNNQAATLHQELALRRTLAISMHAAVVTASAILLTSLVGVRFVAAEESIEEKFLSHVRQVTDGFVKAGEGYFSPDGREIVYQAVPKDYPFYQIYTQPLDGGVPRRVSTGRGRTTCANFSPDGKKLIFASSHLDPQLDATEEAERNQQADDAKTGRRRRYEWNFDPHMDIFESDLDGGNLRRLTDTPGYDAEGAFSPDGRQIAFCSTRDGDPDIYVMNADGSNVRQLTNSPGYDGGPFISPDGKWVVFRSDRDKEGFLQIYVVGIDGAHETPLTTNPNSVNWAPYWHPSEPFIIWTGADHSDPQARPNYDLWLMRYERKDGLILPGPITRVTDNPTADVLPVFSPDGKRLMWTSNRTADHASQLYIGDFQLPK
jgi:TolB protein